jgi:glycosyltransferase involved in cell wall biosynthesis
LSYEIIIINDGSTDNSHNKIISWIQKSNFSSIHYIYSDSNEGKTGAIKKGIKIAKGNYSIIQDGDLEYTVTDIPRLLNYIIQHQLDSVIGYRIRKFQRFSLLDFTLKLGVLLLTFLFNILYHKKFKDLSGGYKIFKTTHLKSIDLKGRGYTFCYEVVIAFLKKNYTVGQHDHCVLKYQKFLK